MRAIVAGALLLVIAPCALGAGDDYAIYVYPCPRTTQSPVIDGVLDDACWEEAPAVGGFTL